MDGVFVNLQMGSHAFSGEYNEILRVFGVPVGRWLRMRISQVPTIRSLSCSDRLIVSAGCQYFVVVSDYFTDRVYCNEIIESHITAGNFDYPSLVRADTALRWNMLTCGIAEHWVYVWDIIRRRWLIPTLDANVGPNIVANGESINRFRIKCYEDGTVYAFDVRVGAAMPVYNMGSMNSCIVRSWSCMELLCFVDGLIGSYVYLEFKFRALGNIAPNTS